MNDELALSKWSNGLEHILITKTVLVIGTLC